MRDYTEADVSWVVRILKRHEKELKKQDDDRWVVGDRLVEMFGPVPDTYHHTSDPKFAVLRRFYEDLCKFFGADMLYEFDWFAECRRIAGRFAKEQRRTNLSFQMHRNAGNPEVLERIIEKAEKEGHRVTSDYIRDMRVELTGTRRPYTPRRPLVASSPAKPDPLAALTKILPKILADMDAGAAHFKEALRLIEENKNKYDDTTRATIIAHLKAAIAELQEGVKRVATEPEVSRKTKAA